MKNLKNTLFCLLFLIGIAHACLVLSFYGFFNIDFQRHIIDQKEVQECSDVRVLKALALTGLAKSFGTDRAAADFWAWSKILSICNVTVLSLLIAVIIRFKGQSEGGRMETDGADQSG